MGRPWQHRIPLEMEDRRLIRGNLGETHGKSMENHGKSMENPWKTMENPWKIHGKSMENPWKIYGKSMENPWKLQEPPLHSHHLPIPRYSICMEYLPKFTPRMAQMWVDIP